MGYFSWCCSKTGQPILAGTASAGWPEDLLRLTKVVLVLPGGTVSGTYDGYGRVTPDKTTGEGDGWTGSEKLTDLGAVKLVVQDAYEGETFAGLTVSPRDPRQGFFWDHDDLRDIVAGKMLAFEPFAEEFSGADPGEAVSEQFLQAMTAAAVLAQSFPCFKPLLDNLGRVRDENNRSECLAVIRDTLAMLDERDRTAGTDPAANPASLTVRRLRLEIKCAETATSVAAPPHR